MWSKQRRKEAEQGAWKPKPPSERQERLARELLHSACMVGFLFEFGAEGPALACALGAEEWVGGLPKGGKEAKAWGRAARGVSFWRAKQMDGTSKDLRAAALRHWGSSEVRKAAAAALSKSDGRVGHAAMAASGWRRSGQEWRVGQMEQGAARASVMLTFAFEPPGGQGARAAEEDPALARARVEAAMRALAPKAHMMFWLAAGRESESVQSGAAKECSERSGMWEAQSEAQALREEIAPAQGKPARGRGRRRL